MDCMEILPMYSNSSRRAMPLCDWHSAQMRANRFCGPSPTRYSINRSNRVLSRGRIGRGSGGPGGRTTPAPEQSNSVHHKFTIHELRPSALLPPLLRLWFTISKHACGDTHPPLPCWRSCQPTLYRPAAPKCNASSLYTTTAAAAAPRWHVTHDLGPTYRFRHERG